MKYTIEIIYDQTQDIETTTKMIYYMNVDIETLVKGAGVKTGRAPQEREKADRPLVAACDRERLA